MLPTPHRHGELEFSLECKGPLVDQFQIRFSTKNGIDTYMRNRDCRRQIWVVPMAVYQRMEQWFGENGWDKSNEDLTVIEKGIENETDAQKRQL